MSKSQRKHEALIPIMRHNNVPLIKEESSLNRHKSMAYFCRDDGGEGEETENLGAKSLPNFSRIMVL